VKRLVLFEKSRASGAGTVRVFRLNGRRESVSNFVFLVFLIGILGSIQVKAQLGVRTLSGRITSPSGDPAANARLVLKNVASSEIRSVKVNSDGAYLPKR
jgi:hypothetical protein